MEKQKLSAYRGKGRERAPEVNHGSQALGTFHTSAASPYVRVYVCVCVCRDYRHRGTKSAWARAAA